MEIILLSVVILVLSVLGLSIGVIIGREPIKGSCGGVACIKGARCAACTRRGVEDGQE